MKSRFTQKLHKIKRKCCCFNSTITWWPLVTIIKPLCFVLSSFYQKINERIYKIDKTYTTFARTFINECTEQKKVAVEMMKRNDSYHGLCGKIVQGLRVIGRISQCVTFKEVRGCKRERPTKSPWVRTAEARTLFRFSARKIPTVKQLQRGICYSFFSFCLRGFTVEEICSQEKSLFYI